MGVLAFEVVAGPGESSRYLARLPGGALARLLRSPPEAVRRRIRPEGFALSSVRREGSEGFRRFDVTDLVEQYSLRGWTVREVMAVAPLTGANPRSAEAVRQDAKSWSHLLTLEEAEGRDPSRWVHAAAVLLAVSPPDTRARTIK